MARNGAPDKKNRPVNDNLTPEELDELLRGMGLLIVVCAVVLGLGLYSGVLDYVARVLP